MKLREDLKDLVPYTAGKKLEGALKLSSNENPLGPSPKAMEAVRAHLQDVNIYPEGTAGALRSALAARDGLDSSRYLVGNGSDEVLTLIAGAYINPGDRALTARHTFSEYNFAVRLFGGTTDTFALKEGSLDLEDAARVLRPEHRIIFLCNPNNPTGGYFSQKALDEFLKKVDPQVLVVLDEAYREYVTAPDFPRSLELLKTHENLVITRTFSKIFGLAALRVGYAVGSPQVIRDLSVVKQPFNVGSLSQAAASAALEDRDFLDLSLKTNTLGKEFWGKALGELGLDYYPTQANFLAVRVPKPAKDVFAAMASSGVVIRPLDSFGLPEWIRITIGMEGQNEKCLSALKAALS